jgi:hypothetical protein
MIADQTRILAQSSCLDDLLGTCLEPTVAVWAALRHIAGADLE